MYLLEKYHDAIRAKVRAPFTDLVPVNITEAARFFYEVSEQEQWSIEKDFPIANPPFPLMWMEYKQPATINSNGKIIQAPPFLDGIGCLAITLDVPESDWGTVVEQRILEKLALYSVRSPADRLDPEVEERVRAMVEAKVQVRWIAIFRIFAFSRRWSGNYMGSEINERGNTMLPSGVFYAYIQPNGVMLEKHILTTIEGRPGMSWEEAQENLIRPSNSVLYPFLFATSLMHAKNVSLVDAQPVSPKVAKKRRKEGKPVIQFKELEVRSMRRQVQSEGEGGDGARRAMHLVRGHWKDFRNGPGLFGRHKNLYWWDMHVAGAKDAGEVVKEYKVKK